MLPFSSSLVLIPYEIKTTIPSKTQVFPTGKISEHNCEY